MGREALTSPGQFLDFVSMGSFGQLRMFEIFHKKKKKKKKKPQDLFFKIKHIFIKAKNKGVIKKFKNFMKTLL
jgi:hypothetical protein